MENSILSIKNSYINDVKYYLRPNFTKNSCKAIAPVSIDCSINYNKILDFKKFINHSITNKRLLNLKLSFTNINYPVNLNIYRSQIKVCNVLLSHHLDKLKKISFRYHPDNTISNQDIIKLGHSLAAKPSL